MGSEWVPWGPGHISISNHLFTDWPTGPLETIMTMMASNIVYSLCPVAHWMFAAVFLAAAFRIQSIAKMAGHKRRQCSHCAISRRCTLRFYMRHLTSESNHQQPLAAAARSSQQQPPVASSSQPPAGSSRHLVRVLAHFLLAP